MIMKITNEGTVSVIETERIHIMVLNDLGQLLPNSMKFRIEYLSDSLLEPTIQGISIEYWLCRMLENKIVSKTEIALSPEMIEFFNRICPVENSILFVENNSNYYISKTLFQILQKLLPEIQFKSIEYELE